MPEFVLANVLKLLSKANETSFVVVDRVPVKLETIFELPTHICNSLISKEIFYTVSILTLFIIGLLSSNKSLYNTIDWIVFAATG